MTFSIYNLKVTSVKVIVIVMCCLVGYSCINSSETSNLSKKEINTTISITDPKEQDSLFKRLIAVSGTIIPENKLDDSLAFLLLPVQASCPSCRRKTIDSIVKHENDLAPNHYIIISGNGGRKTLGSYFREQKVRLPELPNQLILDTINQSGRLELFTDNTVFYYTSKRKVYQKVPAIPDNVIGYLHDFFSGRADN